MKRKLILIISLFIFSQSAIAKKIDLSTAITVANHFYQSLSSNSNSPQFDLQYQHLIKIQEDNAPVSLPAFYILSSTQHGGFVMVSGDDRAHPIIGYSLTSAFDETNMPINAEKWFEVYEQEIHYVIVNNLKATKEITTTWDELIRGNYTHGSAQRGSIAPLLTTTWNQDSYYASQCPSGSVTGCVATAMAQVMKYWNYPQQGTGFHSYNHPYYGTLSANFAGATYNWSSMPNAVFSPNSAVAQLMYHCGVSVDMDYGSVSWASIIGPSGYPSAESAFRNHFGYKSTLTGETRTNYNNSSWINLLKSEINASRPILHGGSGSGGGHAFVCDGYDNADFFHMNWGWGGMMDGYYCHNQLNPNSVGTGGGSGGYNNLQVIIKGIEPANGGSGTNATSIDLHASITVNPSPILSGQSVTVTTNIKNNGNSSFLGEVTAALFDQSYNFVETVGTYTENSGLPAGYHYTNPLAFTNAGLTAAPGSYYIGIFVKPNGGNWQQAGNGAYTNLIPVTIIYNNTNDIRMYSNITANPSTITQNQAATFNFDIGNYGTSAFNGDVSIDLHDLNGNWIELIDGINNLSLCSNCHYTGGLNFSTTGLNVQPGTYLLAAWQISTGGSWELVEATSSYPNPIQIVIAEPQLPADIYENNNSNSSAYALPLSFSGNSTTVKTNGSSLHTQTDIDYYKLNLPSGYSYTFNTRAHDSYNSNNGNSYTCDVLWSYDAGNGWSNPYDDINIDGNFTVIGGGSIYFQVAPYFAGMTGTYLLDMQITRSVYSSSKEVANSEGIQLFPNPANEHIILNFENKEWIGKDAEIEILNMAGQRLDIQQVQISENLKISATQLAEGTYIARVKSNENTWLKKFVIIH